MLLDRVDLFVNKIIFNPTRYVNIFQIYLMVSDSYHAVSEQFGTRPSEITLTIEVHSTIGFDLLRHSALIAH